MRKLLLLLLRFYQYAISPMMASHCRYYPTCSQYAVEAITHHGGLKGLLLSIRRLLRCHPWAKAGYDPVPGTDDRKGSTPTVTACCKPAGQNSTTNPTKR
ncbi:membrane protein insertion efficiency factor YidD [Marinobacter sp.]|uniref:membrane protein insertion efficiency factor YidD n=1 Tax=Marinobacter sp. TaxID=50741 RepID=UPI002B46E1FE|nr:membrane protein insertion efficiency factor YidD [Marinobacter sp.]HKK56559.1 membrane protein insertion efficiency factor YidD [Marinobacter sp.]